MNNVHRYIMYGSEKSYFLQMYKLTPDFGEKWEFSHQSFATIYGRNISSVVFFHQRQHER